MQLTVDRLRALLEYNPDTGVFTRRVTTSSRAIAGAAVGTISGNGYLQFRVDGRIYLAHRLAWLYMTGQWPDRDIDHIDGTRNNNQWKNMRAATRSQNIANSGIWKSNRTGHKGVVQDRTLAWRAAITIDGKYLALGTFQTKEQAHAAYRTAAVNHFGEFARV